MKNTLSIKPTTALWLLMTLSFWLSPLSPSVKKLGFHSVELMFFGFVALFGWMTVLYFLIKGSFLIKIDKVIYFCVAFIILCVFSMFDAPKLSRSILVTGQYLPYFFMMYICITLVKTQYGLNKLIMALTHLTFLFSIMVFVAAMYFNDRGKLDTFLLDAFVIELTKVLVYIELIFSVLVYRAFHVRSSRYETLVLIVCVLAIIGSGGRTNIGVMGVAFGFAFLTSKASLKKFLIVLGVFACFVVMVFTTSYLQERLQLMVVTGSKDYDDKIVAFSRVYTTQLAFEVIRTFPINGTGIGNLSSYTENVIKTMRGIPERILYYWNEHTKLTGAPPFETTVTPIKYAAELGIGGFVFFFGFYYYLWRRVKTAIKVATGSLKDTLLGMRLFVVISLVHNLLDPGITNYYSWFYYGLVIAGTRIAYVECEDMRLAISGPSITERAVV
jgi:hypothetical protein